MPPRAALLALLLPLSLTACGKVAGPEQEGPPADAAVGGTPRTPAFSFAPGQGIADEELGDFHVVLECSVGGQPTGPLTFELWPKAAPQTVRRFLRLCDEGWYDGTRFPRILRDYVVQGGDRVGDGTGTSPYGQLPAEISIDQEYDHHYGVLALAEPPAMQFVVCVAESTKVWALDASGLNTFGKLVHGVSALESLANAPVINVTGERSKPTAPVVLERAVVVRGPAPQREDVVRPLPDLHGEPEKVAVRHILVTFLERGQRLGVTRNRREAEALARECYERLRSGELDFDQARDMYSDEEYPEGIVLPLWRISNYGVYDPGQRARQTVIRESNAYQAELRALRAAGEITAEEMTERLQERALELGAMVATTAVDRREEITAPGYADVAFQLDVGEVGLVPFDPNRAPAGFYVIKRFE